MSWQCTLTPSIAEQVLDIEPWPVPIGTLWFVQAGKVATDRLSADHILHRNGQPTLWVQLPGGPFCIDACTGEGAQWSRNGEPPNITVNPSINEIDVWHGWIKNGVMTDDVEGRNHP